MLATIGRHPHPKISETMSPCRPHSLTSARAQCDTWSLERKINPRLFTWRWLRNQENKFWWFKCKHIIKILTLCTPRYNTSPMQFESYRMDACMLKIQNGDDFTSGRLQLAAFPLRMTIIFLWNAWVSNKCAWFAADDRRWVARNRSPRHDELLYSIRFEQKKKCISVTNQV